MLSSFLSVCLSVCHASYYAISSHRVDRFHSGFRYFDITRYPLQCDGAGFFDFRSRSRDLDIMSVCLSRFLKNRSPPTGLTDLIRVFDILIVLNALYNLTEPDFSISGQGQGQGHLKVKS